MVAAAFSSWTRRRLGEALLALALCLAPLCAGAADPMTGLRREPMMLDVTLPNGDSFQLETMVTRPDRPGRFPLVIMIHGTPRTGTRSRAQANASVTPAQFDIAAVAFARRGYAAAAVLRRGFGHSTGRYAELTPGPTCDSWDYTLAAKASGEDVTAAVAALRRQSWVDADHVILLGQSTGGMAVMQANANGVEGVRGVLNFSGGNGSYAPGHVCNAESDRANYARMGRTARLPTLWLSAENDHYFSPALARVWHQAFTEAGGASDFELLPAFGSDGHDAIYNAPEDFWWPHIAPFLQRIGMPTAPVIDLPPIPPLDPPQGMNNPGCKARFAAFVMTRGPAKAFAYSPGDDHCGNAGGSTAEEAATLAMQYCEALGRNCRIYAIGHALAAP